MTRSYSILQLDEQDTTSLNLKAGYISSFHNFHQAYISLTKKDIDQLRFCSVEIQHSVPTESILECQNELAESHSDLHVLPMAVRYISKSGYYYIERPPFKINVSYKNARAYSQADQTQDLSIWIPWTITVLPPSFINRYDPNDVKIFYSNQSLKDLKSNYLTSFLPNSHTDGRVCWSSSFTTLTSGDKIKDESSSFDFRYWHSMLFNDYMLGGWNNDLTSKSLLFITNRDNRIYSQRYFDQMKDIDYKTKYPLLHKYRETDKYPDLFNSLVSVVIDKFNVSRKKAIKVISKDSGNFDSSNDNYDFMKFFSFMSILSLEETLSFYSEVINIYDQVKKTLKRRDHYYGANDVNYYLSSFSDILGISSVEDECSINEDRFYSLGLPLNYPLVKTISGKNPKFPLEKASSFYKNVKIVFALQNISSKQNLLLDHGHDYYNWDDIIYFFNKEKYNINPFYSFLNTLKNSDQTFIFIKVDCSNKTYEFFNQQDYLTYIDSFKAKALENISTVVKTKSNKHLLDSVSNILNQQNEESVFVKI